MMDAVWCSDFFLQMLVSLMVEWGVKQRNGEAVQIFYMYATKQNEQTSLLGYERVCPIDLKQNVHLERQKITRKEERKQGDFYNNFYRRRQAEELTMPNNGTIVIVYNSSHFSATTDNATQDDRVQKMARFAMVYVEFHTPEIRKIREKLQGIAPIYEDLYFFVDSLNKLHLGEIAPDSATTDKTSCIILDKQRQIFFSDFISESRKQETAICESISQVRTLMLELFPFSIDDDSYLMKTPKTKTAVIAREGSIGVEPREVLLEKIRSSLLNIITNFQFLEEELSLVKKNLGKDAQELIKDIEDIFLRDTRDSNIDLLVLGINSMRLVNSIALMYEMKTEEISTELEMLRDKLVGKDTENEEE